MLTVVTADCHVYRLVKRVFHRLGLLAEAWWRRKAGQRVMVIRVFLVMEALLKRQRFDVQRQHDVIELVDRELLLLLANVQK